MVGQEIAFRQRTTEWVAHTPFREHNREADQWADTCAKGRVLRMGVHNPNCVARSDWSLWILGLQLRQRQLWRWHCDHGLKEILITQEDDEFIFPIADGTAKLSGRDYEFRAPTLKAGTYCEE